MNQEIVTVQEEEKQDIYDLVLCLYGVNDAISRDSKLNSLIRLGGLIDSKANVVGKLNKQVLKSADDAEELFNHAIKSLEKGYLLKILDDLLGISLNALSKTELSNESILSAVLNEIGYLDGKNFQKKLNTSFRFLDLDEIFLDERKIKILLNDLFKYENEFSGGFISKNDNAGKRLAIIHELFKGNFRDYLQTFKEKTPLIAQKIYKQLLYLELQQLDCHQLSDFIRYFMEKPIGVRYLEDQNNEYKKAKLLLQNSFLHLLMKDGQKEFCKILECIRLNIKNEQSPKLTDEEKNLISILFWLKNSPKESLKKINLILEILNKQFIFAEDSPNLLFMHLNSIEEEVSKLVNKSYKSSVNKAPSYTIQNVNYEGLNKISEVCNKVNTKTLEICQKVLGEEEKIVRKLISEWRAKILRKVSKAFSTVVLVFVLLFSMKFGSYYFFDIESNYKNNFLRSAKLSVEAIPYPVGLKDSVDPVRNEIRQRERLDQIKDLNLRYFKTLTLFLAPEIPEDVIKKSISNTQLPEEIQNLDKINNIRNSLVSLISKGEWNTTYGPLIGFNVLTELRSYGAISNFLIPPLAYHVIKDSSGLPVRLQSSLQVYRPPKENEILRNDLINRFSKIPEVGDQPGIYVRKYDLNYKKIAKANKILIKKLQTKKKELIGKYREETSRKDQLVLKDTLKVIAMLEFRLKDLQEKISHRYNYIVTNNTYRLPLDY